METLLATLVTDVWDGWAVRSLQVAGRKEKINQQNGWQWASDASRAAADDDQPAERAHPPERFWPWQKGKRVACKNTFNFSHIVLSKTKLNLFFLY